MTQQRLAAVMFTDIVGYTVLMGSDKEKAFILLRKNREIHQQLIKKYRGERIKEMGDGILAHFNSATDAVQCAIEIQQRVRDELEGEVRIGIHLGDVTFESGDVFGDGVNIASRLQSIADPGGIYLSESTQKAIRGNVNIQTKCLGEFNLKNVDYPVRTYCVRGESLPIPSSAKINKLIQRSLKERVIRSGYTYLVILLLLLFGWWLRKEHLIDKSAISSLIFLPFENYTGTDTLDYLLAGMHAELIGEAGKISAWRVTSKTTANAYRNVEKSIPEITSETNSDAAVEISVSCFGENVCFQVAIVSASEDKQLWIKDYNVEKNQISNLLRSLPKEISEEINVSLTPQEEVFMAESRKVDPIAYDLYMKGQVYNDQINKDGLEKATQFFILAIERDPEWAPPYARMASVVSRQYQLGFIERSVAVKKQKEYFSKALELDPNSSDAHNQIAGTAAWVEWNWEKAENEFLKSIELNPNNSSSHMFYAHLLTNLRRTDEALQHAKKATELDPLNPITLALSVRVLVEAGNCEAALSQVEKALSIEPDHLFANRKMITVAECLGDYEKAFEIIKQMNFELWEEYAVTATFEKVFQENGWLAFIEELIKVNEEVFAKEVRLSDKDLADKYLSIKKYNKALDYYEKAFENHSPRLPYFSSKPIYNELKDNPRYIALLKKMNLPVE